MTRPAWLMFAAVSALWGIPYLLITIAVAQLAPPVVVVGRTAMAAVVLLPIAIAVGALRPLRGRLGSVVLLAVLHIAGPFLLITYGEGRLTSSLTALLLASQPMMTAALAARFGTDERVTGRSLAGLAVGFFGVAVLVGIDLGGDRYGLFGAALILLATAGNVTATLLVRRKLVDVPPLGLAAGTLTLATVVLAPWALATAPDTLPDARVVASMVVLGLLGTAVALPLYYRLIGLIGAARSTVVAYLHPLAAVAFGVVLVGQPFTLAAVPGAVLILAGTWLCLAVPGAEAPATDRSTADRGGATGEHRADPVRP